MTTALRGPVNDWLDEIALPEGYGVTETGHWTLLSRPDGVAANVAQGWKLHVSARPQSLRETLLAAIPVLLGRACDFKVVSDPAVLSAFNHGLYGLGAVGKAITVYPAQDEIVELATVLADALQGFEAPRIPSDRRFRTGAPVYYRFGPFWPRVQIDGSGYVDVTVEAPDGTRQSGSAGDTYSAPLWAQDPFGAGAANAGRLPRMDGAPVIGTYYRVQAAISRTARGTTYRATDVRTGRGVVIKSASAFVNESSTGDARSYLRHELRVLKALDGIDQVPRAIDHFAYGPDEYLVVTELGDTDLRNDVVERGTFSLEPRSPRSVVALAQSIIRALDAVHERNVVYRDLSPQNLVAMPEGEWGLVDFELSCLDRQQRFGWTPGFAPPAQRENIPASPEDDYYSLGAVLFFAVMGMDPIIVNGEPTFDTDRTLDSLRLTYGVGSPIISVVGELLSSHPTDRAGAVAHLREIDDLPRDPTPSPPQVRHHPSKRPLLEGALISVVALAAASLQAGQHRSLPPTVVAQVGSAGAVAELAQHSAGLATAQDLASEMAPVIRSIDAPAGLLYGRMGVSVALHAAADATGNPLLRQDAREIMPNERDIANEAAFDVAHGLAGLGIGYLKLAQSATATDDLLRLADQCARSLIDRFDEVEERFDQLPVGNPAHGVSIAHGFAHGRAGVAYFLLAHAALSGEDRSAGHARALLDGLLMKAPELTSLARSPTARPMAASWCQGLAGIGTTLIRGAVLFEDERYLGAAHQAAEACLDLAPRVPLITQCCGLAGVGELLLDLGLVTEDAKYARGTSKIVEIMLSRSGGSADGPDFQQSNLMDDSLGWGTGSAGLLGFLRRWMDPGSPRLWMADTAQLLPGLKTSRSSEPGAAAGTYVVGQRN